jgi:hypothetical protein
LLYENIQYASVNIYIFCRGLGGLYDGIVLFLGCRSKLDMGGLRAYVRGLQKNAYTTGLCIWENMYTHLSAVGEVFYLDIDW